MKKLKLIISSISLVVLSSCINDTFDEPNTATNCNDIPSTKTVASLFSTATTVPVQYTNDDVIEAYVTSSDEGGNFYKSISLVSTDNNIGFSIPIDQYNLYTKFEPGRKVSIKLKDLYFDKKTQTASNEIGALYNGTIGRMSGVEFEKSILRSCTKINEDNITIKNLTITQIKNDAYINKLIELDAVQFDDAFVGKSFYDASNQIGGATNNLIKDVYGSSLIVRVSEFANFAAKIIPNGNGKIRGVLTKYNSDYQFMIRTEADVKMNNPRITPMIDESFTSNYASWFKFSVIGTEAWSLSTTNGNPGSMAKMNGFNGTAKANEDWLISPVINLSGKTTASLSFDTATKFAGNPLEIFISTNYSGSGNPNLATWTALSGYTLGVSTPGYVWTGSGLINISAFAGQNIYIGFKYTSTTAAAATWEVDNVRVVAQ